MTPRITVVSIFFLSPSLVCPFPRSNSLQYAAQTIVTISNPFVQYDVIKKVVARTLSVTIFNWETDVVRRAPLLTDRNLSLSRENNKRWTMEVVIRPNISTGEFQHKIAGSSLLANWRLGSWISKFQTCTVRIILRPSIQRKLAWIIYDSTIELTMFIYLLLSYAVRLILLMITLHNYFWSIGERHDVKCFNS